MSPALKLLEKLKPRSGQLVMTVFGDSIVPRSSTISLGHLIEMMATLQMSERLVRTVVYRLTQENWLTSSQKGRRSYYKITASGLAAFAAVDARIYAAAPPHWDGRWIVAQILADATATDRKTLRDLFTWHGFGQLSPTFWFKPGTDASAIKQTISNAGLDGLVAVFSSQLEKSIDKTTIAKLGWDLQNLSDEYARFQSDFATVSALPDNPQDAFIIRTLLINQYRHILQRDPQLPLDLLPSNWSGNRAREHVASFYRALTPDVEKYLTGIMQPESRKAFQPTDSYFQRFAES